MKKIISSFIIAAFLLSLSLSVAACAKPQAESGDSMTISSFESYDELQTFSWFNNFGRVDVNENSAFITNGSKSARLELHGNPSGNMPTMYIWCDTKYFSNYNFSSVMAITVDVFNESSKDVKMNLSFVTRKNKVRKEYPPTEFNLTSGKNNITYLIDRQVAKYLCDTDSMEYIKIEFEQPNSYTADRNVLYMDNLVAHIDHNEVAPIVKTFKENEIFLFEDSADRFNIKAYSTQCSSKSFPKLSINSNLNFVSEGKQSLKIDVVVNPTDRADAFPGLHVDKKYLDNFDWETMNDTDTISVEMYNTASAPKRIYFGVTDSLGKYTLATYKDLTPSAWTKLEFSIGDLKDAGLDVAKLGYFQINYGHEYSGTTYSFYMDNFRFNKN